MARIRVREKLLDKKYLPHSFLEWVLFLLETIGRLAYKSLFFILKITAKSCYYVFYTIKHLIQSIKLTKLPSINLPSVKLPTIKIPSIVLPKIKPPRIKISLPKISLPKISLKIPVFKSNVKTLAFLFTSFFALGLAFYFYLNILQGLPSPDKLITRDQVVSTKLYDRNGKLLFTIFNGNQNRSLVKLENIPDFAKNATLAIEDKDFYKHPGFSWRGIARAFWRNFSNSGLQGGSTITQQLVKNALLSSEKTWQRKIKEVVLSIQVELIFSKDEILQMYFNEVPYGGTAYGIEEASQTYFGKSVKEINLAEATLLAGLPAAPTKYSPFGANPKLAIVRQHQVLDNMIKDGYLTSEQAEEVKKQKIILAPQTTNIKAPHFVMYVKDLLVEKYGTKMVEQGGLKVITSLDLNLQEMAQKHVVDEINKLINMRVSNGAALVTNPQTGEILAMVGSRDYFDLERDGNVNVTIMPRQIGSAIKPVTYAVALSNGFTPATIIPDTPITYKIPGSEPYSPVNYDGRFHGNVPLRMALGSSYNIPAVKTVAVFGVNKLIDLAQSMGITTWNDRSRFGLSLTLGAGEVKMTDMAVVYGTLANLGNRVNLKPILKITDYKAKAINEVQEEAPERVLDAKVAYLLTDILKDNQARTPAFGPASLLVVPDHEVAVKTGTTNDKKDNWTIGYTQDYLTAVWVGNNDNTPMSAVASGITGASPIWHNIMVDLLKDRPAQQFAKPQELVKISVCIINGLLPCEGCPSKEEYFLPGTEPKYHCNSEEIKKILEDQKKVEENKILQGNSTQG